MYRYSKSTVTLPDFPIFGLSVPPKFIFPKFGVTDLPIFVFTLPDYRKSVQKVGRQDTKISVAIQQYNKTTEFTSSILKPLAIFKPLFTSILPVTIVIWKHVNI